MMACRSLVVLGWIGALSMLAPVRAQARSIEVSGSRVRMGDLVAGVPEPWASLDMGPAPDPMQDARYTEDDILARLDRAHMRLPDGYEVPRVLRVVRSGQTLTEPHLAQLVRQSLISHLPPGTRIRDVRLSGGVALPSGRVHIEPELPETLASGEQMLRLKVSTEPVRRGVYAAETRAHQRTAAVLIEAFVDLDMQTRRSSVPVLSRGSEVTVQVRTHGVLVQASGLAQEAGSIGDFIKVLPNQGSRMVQARILDARTVEVRL